jgi:hypothetical protein
MLSRFFIVILFLNFYQYILSQDGSVRVKVFGGSSIDFVFNSISKYKNGIPFPPSTVYQTVLGIEATDPAGGTDRTAWRIEVRAEDADGDGNLNGTNPANTIPLSAVEIQATSIASCVPVPCPINLFGSPWIPLSNIPAILVDGNALGGPDDIIAGTSELAYTTDQIRITYRCGVTTSLLGRPADFYSENIFLDIYLTPPF